MKSWNAEFGGTGISRPDLAGLFRLLLARFFVLNEFPLMPLLFAA
jgi:hypothetical protein